MDPHIKSFFRRSIYIKTKEDQSISGVSLNRYKFNFLDKNYKQNSQFFLTNTNNRSWFSEKLKLNIISDGATLEKIFQITIKSLQKFYFFQFLFYRCSCVCIQPA